MDADVFSLDGNAKGKVAVPSIFENEIRPELILRAVIAEQTKELQPQGHYPLAGMQTTARYYGRMHSYRSGRHMGVAIRPRQKLGGGTQGQVRIIPSATKGKRAHPHMIEKATVEEINKKEYQKALASAISATKIAAPGEKPIIVSNEIESITKTKEMLKLFNTLKLSKELESKSSVRKGLRRLAKQKHYRKTLLLVIGKDNKALKAARNIAGVDACTITSITANLLAPGGVPGRVTVWSEHAVKGIEDAIKKQSLWS
jgi:large subunit ribosomal protein L4e